jgi:hypothetical protein
MSSAFDLNLVGKSPPSKSIPYSKTQSRSLTGGPIFCSVVVVVALVMVVVALVVVIVALVVVELALVVLVTVVLVTVVFVAVVEVMDVVAEEVDEFFAPVQRLQLLAQYNCASLVPTGSEAASAQTVGFDAIHSAQDVLSPKVSSAMAIS